MADEIRRLIRVRTQKGARFKRDGFGKKPQISDSWRKPRGQHNKQREQRKAKGALPKPGFGSPTAVRGMHPSGFFEVLVFKSGDLEGLDPKTQSIRISGTVGGRKRASIQDKALAAGLRVLNARAAEPAKKPESPAKEEKKPVKKQEPKKGKKPVKKTVPKKGAVKKTPSKKEAEPVKKDTRKEEKPVPDAKKPEPKEPEAEKAKSVKAPKKRAVKPEKETGAEPKPKKASMAKDKAENEAKPAKKTAVKQKKKSGKEGEEQ